jgi:spermidine synthase
MMFLRWIGVVAMRHLATFNGRRGEIVILEDLDTGARCYFEDGVFQSHATWHGISLFAYVHLMARVLRRAEDVLLLGCASGSLATMLHYLGKRVTIVDDNPLSFDIARQFFGLPDKVNCIEADFREFLTAGQSHFDGIGVDIGAAEMQFAAEFDLYTCQAICGRLSANGRIAMNIVVHHDIEQVPDRILAMLSAHERTGWIYDRPGEIDRNAVLVVARTTKPCLGPPLDTGGYPVERLEWSLRRQRHYLVSKPNTGKIIAPACEC